MILIGSVSHLITQIPQHIRHRLTSLQHICATSKIICKLWHMLPPGLTTQERSANLRSERCARLLEINLWVVGIGMEYIVGYTFNGIEVRNLLQHLPMFIPGESKRGERLRRHTRLTINTRSRSCWFDRLKLQSTDIRRGEWLPILTHRYVGIFVILHTIGGEYIASRGLISNQQTLLVTQISHSLVEFIHKQTTYVVSPIEQEAGRGIHIIHHISPQGRYPAAKLITRKLLELLLHFRSPRLRVALPAIEQHTLQQTTLQSTIGQATNIPCKVGIGTLGREFVTLPASTLGWCRCVSCALIDVTHTQNCPAVIIGSYPPQIAFRVHILRDINHLVTLNTLLF